MGRVTNTSSRNVPLKIKQNLKGKFALFTFLVIFQSNMRGFKEEYCVERYFNTRLLIETCLPRIKKNIARQE